MITQEEKTYAMERMVSMIENNYIRKEIQKQKTITQATRKAKELCNMSGFTDNKMSTSGFPKGIRISTEDNREGEISWRELAEYVRGETKEQVSLF